MMQRKFPVPAFSGVFVVLMALAFVSCGETGAYVRRGALPGRSEAGTPARKVRFTMYVMSQCPFAAQVQRAIAPVLKKLGDAVDFQMHFVGDEPNPGVLMSMHGATEVAGDKYEVCTVKHAPGKYMDVIVCMAEDFRNIPQNFDGCAADHGVDPAPIRKCAEGVEGAALLSASFEASRYAEVRGSPTMFIDGVRYGGGRQEMDFMRAICAAFDSGAPEVCTSLPEPMRVPVTVLSDRRCTKCLPDKIVVALKNMFPGLEVRNLDFADAEGRALYDSLLDKGVKFLPAFLFAPSVVEDPAYEQVERFIVDAGDYKLLQIGAKFDPKAEICDNRIDDDGDAIVDCTDPDCEGRIACRDEIPKRLDVFVMSLCPFGVKALNALPEVLDAFKEDGVTFAINYIAEELPDGSFKALHGQPEVDENMRQLCAINHYGKDNKFMEYILCRNKDIRNVDWNACAVSGIDPVVMEKCFADGEGRALLSENIKNAKALEIGASPTWLANNRNTFPGIAPEKIRRQFCEYNQDLKGCVQPLSEDDEGTADGPKCGN